MNRSNSSTFVVARINVASFVESTSTSMRVARRRRIGERPTPCAPGRSRTPRRRRCATSHADLLVDVLDVLTDRLGRDAEVVGDLLVRPAAHQNEQDLELPLRQSRGSSAVARARDGRRRRAPRRPHPGRAVRRLPPAGAPPRRPERRAKAGAVVPRAWLRSNRRPRGSAPEIERCSSRARGDSPSVKPLVVPAARRPIDAGRRTGRRRAPSSADGAARAPLPEPSGRASPRSRSTHRRGRGRARARLGERRRRRARAGPAARMRPRPVSATLVECSRSHGVFRPVSAAMAAKQRRPAPFESEHGKGSASSPLPDSGLVEPGEELARSSERRTRPAGAHAAPLAVR